jgi:diguanylate cyclase
MASDPERKRRTDRPATRPLAASGIANGGSSASTTRSTSDLAQGASSASVPGNGASTIGGPWPLPLWCEAAGDPLHRRLSLENRQLALRLRGLEAELRTLRQALRRATSDALTDPLTGLANRRAFDAALEALAASGAASAGGWASVPQLLIADIDSFKTLNDAHGHDFGDAVLCITGELLASSVRRDCTIARLGGDEFALLLPGQTAPDPAGIGTRAIAERLCARIAGRPLSVRGQPGRCERITLSVGIAGWQSGERPADWYARADQALYAAKRGGRNRVVAAG